LHVKTGSVFFDFGIWIPWVLLHIPRAWPGELSLSDKLDIQVASRHDTFNTTSRTRAKSEYQVLPLLLALVVLRAPIGDSNRAASLSASADNGSICEYEQNPLFVQAGKLDAIRTPNPNAAVNV